ncbi:M24 family metallopeptidase [Chloroflexota bacterium]
MASISKNELERRWGAVRQSMKEEGLDFLIMHNVTDILGGNVKWFTDMAARNNYPLTVIFPREDDMTVVRHGPQATTKLDQTGFKQQIGVPVLPSLGFSTTFDAAKVVEELAKYKNCNVGLVGMGFIPAAFYNYLVKHLSTAKITDATDLVDNIKVIKSDEEMEHIKELCALQDATLEYTLTRIQPGKRNFEIYADIMYQCLQTGSSQANIMINSSPAGTGDRGGGGQGGRVIEDGDQISLLIESNGPSGYYTEILRTVCLGKVSPELQEQYKVAQEAQRKILGMLKPGVDPMTIWDANNEFLKSKSYAEERRLLAHGMGYDMVERPSIQLGETMKIQAGMNIAAHATVVSDKAVGAVCENYLVKETGEPECLHKTPQKVFVL